jgi:beta-lactamase class A
VVFCFLFHFLDMVYNKAVKTKQLIKNHTSRKHIWQLTLGLVASLILGAVIGWFWRSHTETTMAQTKLVRQNSIDYKFVNPIILAQTPENTSDPVLQSLKSSITQYIAAAKSKNTVTDASVYFRRMNTDSWVGVNADDTYAPASMLKTVSLVAFLRAEQQNPALASDTATIDTQGINTDTNQDYYPPQQTVQLGGTYATQELLSRMIIDSDNNAAFAIDEITGKDLLGQTYKDLTIPDPNKTVAIDFISPKIMSRVFRSLYNGAYLSAPVSEEALDLLSKTTFTQGLVAGVPVGTTVAHKFGERTIGITDANNPAASETIKELHDCGIVYYPNDPYLLCVMTKGNDFPTLQKVISDISAMTWNSMAQLDGK